MRSKIVLGLLHWNVQKSAHMALEHGVANSLAFDDDTNYMYTLLASMHRACISGSID